MGEVEKDALQCIVNQLAVLLRENYPGRVGMPVFVHRLDAQAEQADVRKLIGELNKRPDISGILVQTMHDKGLRIVAHECLNPAKDPEGVTAYHRQKLVYGEAEVLPCTPAAIRLLIKEACGADLQDCGDRQLQPGNWAAALADARL